MINKYIVYISRNSEEYESCRVSGEFTVEESKFPVPCIGREDDDTGIVVMDEFEAKNSFRHNTSEETKTSFCVQIAAAIENCLGVDLESNVPVTVLTHWGGGSSDEVRDLEKSVRDVPTDDFFREWEFYSISSLDGSIDSQVPIVIDVHQGPIEIPSAEELWKRIETRKKASSESKCLLTDKEALKIITNKKAVYVFGYDGKDNEAEELKCAIDNALKKKNALTLYFIVNRDGVCMLSNWDAWNGEKSVVGVVQRLRDSIESPQEVFIYSGNKTLPWAHLWRREFKVYVCSPNGNIESLRNNSSDIIQAWYGDCMRELGH